MNSVLDRLPTSPISFGSFRFDIVVRIVFGIAIAVIIVHCLHWQFCRSERLKPGNENETNQPSAPSARDAEKPRRGKTDATYRLRGIPATSEKTDIPGLLQKAWTIPESTKVTVHSLSSHPFRPDKKIATISFSEMPAFLLSPEHDDWIAAVDDETELLLDKHFRGFTPLHSDFDADCVLDCIAVSGLGGHPFGSFKSRDRSFMWLRDGLPRDLPQTRIFTYGYDAKTAGSKSFEGITDLGIELQQAIHQISPGKNSQRKPLVLIGHSLGGLIIKQATINLYQSETEDDKMTLLSFRAGLFFGVPSLGMNIKSLIPMVQGKPNEDLVRSLKSTSETLRRQKSPFDKASKSFSRYWYYETMESRTAELVGSRWSMTGPYEILVEPHSATNGHAQSESDGHFVQPINQTHSDMVKFPHREDRYYLKVVEHLKRIKQEVPKSKGNGQNPK